MLLQFPCKKRRQPSVRGSGTTPHFTQPSTSQRACPPSISRAIGRLSGAESGCSREGKRAEGPELRRPRVRARHSIFRCFSEASRGPLDSFLRHFLQKTYSETPLLLTAPLLQTTSPVTPTQGGRAIQVCNVRGENKQQRHDPEMLLNGSPTASRWLTLQSYLSRRDNKSATH